MIATQLKNENNAREMLDENIDEYETMEEFQNAYELSDKEMQALKENYHVNDITDITPVKNCTVWQVVKEEFENDCCAIYDIIDSLNEDGNNVDKNDACDVLDIYLGFYQIAYVKETNQYFEIAI